MYDANHKVKKEVGSGTRSSPTPASSWGAQLAAKAAAALKTAQSTPKSLIPKVTKSTLTEVKHEAVQASGKTELRTKDASKTTDEEAVAFERAMVARERQSRDLLPASYKLHDLS